jgi:hypothetical protein
MGYRPPKGVRPPQLEGKRTGRPKGSKNYAYSWRDVLWAYQHRHAEYVTPPNAAALVWWYFARWDEDGLQDFLLGYGKL